MSLPTREEAVALLEKYNDNESLRRHGLAVEAVMRHFAAKLGEDPEYWGLVGLLHDVAAAYLSVASAVWAALRWTISKCTRT